MGIYIYIAKNVTNMRQKNGLSQEELAYKAGIDRSYLSEIETGKKNPSITILDQLADALDTSIPKLLKGYKRY